MINTMSAFYYGHTVTEENIYINFIEDNLEKVAILNVGTYSLSEFAFEVARALTVAGEQDYVVTVDRATRKLTISAPNPFELPFFNGSSGNNPYELMGFSRIDRSGSNIYEGDYASGEAYLPQFPLQEYVDFAHSQKAVSAAVNRAASGKSFEVISFGKEQNMKCNIMFATDIYQGQGAAIESRDEGVLKLQFFMEYITTKATIEFMPDRDTPSIFHKCILLSTPESKEGVGFDLNEMYGRGAAGYFETGKLTFIKVI
jgi:hypothetical protein